MKNDSIVEFKNIFSSFILISLLFIQTSCGQVQTDSDTQVIGGGFVSGNSYPEVLRFSDEGCTAVKLSNHHILTAAHCVSLRGSATFNERFGQGNQLDIDHGEKSSSKPFKVTIKQTVVHPDWGKYFEALAQLAIKKPKATPEEKAALYDKSTDLAIIETTTSISGTSARLQADPVKVGSVVTLVGAGCTQLQEETDGRLRQVDLIVKKLLPAHFATVSKIKKQPRGACPGDSGGGTFQLNENGESFLVGITSNIEYKNALTGEGLTTYINRLDSKDVHDWINQQIQSGH